MFEAEEKDSPRPEKHPVVCAESCKQGLGRVPECAIGKKKVLSKHYGFEEATWELEDAM